MATKRDEDPLARLGFAPLDSSNPLLLLYTPKATATTSHSDPKLIILSTWLGGATPSRIARYCRSYQSIYPSSSILVLQSLLSDITIKSFATVQKQLEPAQNYLRTLFAANWSSTTRTEPSEAALVHVFSHGGCNSMIQLSRLLRGGNQTQTPFPVPLIGLILDSCPGSQSFFHSYSAAVHSLPKSQPANLLGRIALFPGIGTFSTLQSLGVIPSITDLRRELNEPPTFGLAPRLYLHSKGDVVVPVASVESHAEELGRLGIQVTRETWKTAQHCGLPAEDAERYYDAIKAFVARAGSREVKL